MTALRTQMRFLDDSELFRVSDIVFRQRSEPIVIVQAAEEGVLQPVLAEIRSASRFEHCESSSALLAETLQHDVPIIEQERIERDGRFDALAAPGHEHDGHMKPPPKRDSNGRLASDLCRCASHQRFHHRHMRDNFRRRPRTFFRRRPPVLSRNRVRRGFESFSRASKLIDQGPEAHESEDYSSAPPARSKA
jgi:hypothetical protein